MNQHRHLDKGLTLSRCLVKSYIYLKKQKQLSSFNFRLAVIRALKCLKMRGLFVSKDLMKTFVSKSLMKLNFILFCT